MKNPVEVLLEDDHESLDLLLTELNSELAKPDSARAFELLDLFWARLAVHIRAENLHLFPALANADQSRVASQDTLPTAEEAHEVLLHLRSDHDFFMKELAEMMKAAREIAVLRLPSTETSKLRQRLTVIRRRLETHNLLEESQVYKWPSFFDEKTIAALLEGLRHELENLPPRFAKSHSDGPWDSC